MIAADPLHAAISAHRAAWEAFQVAPDGRDAEFAEDAMHEALRALVVAANAFPILAGPLPTGTAALLAHLRWWLGEEAEFADDYQPDYRILQARAVDLAAALKLDAHDGPDPVIAAVARAAAISANHMAVAGAVAGDDSDAAEARFLASGREADAAAAALRATRPTTLAGLMVLARYHAADIGDRDPGADALAHLVEALGGIRAPIILPPISDSPILTLIATADAASAAHTAVLADLDENDDEQMRRHNTVTAAAGEAHAAVLRAMPVTSAELRALAAYHVRDGKLYDRDKEAVEHLAAALARVLP